MSDKTKIRVIVIVLGVALVWGLVFHLSGHGGSGSGCQSTNSCFGSGYDSRITNDHSDETGP